MNRVEKSVNDMSIEELQGYLSKRIKNIYREIATTENKITALKNEILDNERTIKIIERSEDVKYLTNIGNRFELDLNPDPLFFELIKVILKDTIEQRNIQIEYNIKEAKQSIFFYRSDLKTIDTCPLCGGMGQKIKVEYLRQGGTVQQIRHVDECHGCKGTGKILNISKV